MGSHWVFTLGFWIPTPLGLRSGGIWALGTIACTQFKFVTYASFDDGGSHLYLHRCSIAGGGYIGPWPLRPASDQGC